MQPTLPIFRLCFIVVLALSFTSLHAQCTNGIFTNGDFEGGLDAMNRPDGWFGFGLGETYAIVSGNGGGDAAELTASGGFGVLAQDNNSVTAGTTYDFSVDLDYSGTSATYGGMEVIWYDATDTPLAPATSFSTPGDNTLYGGGGGWETRTGTQEAPTGAVRLRVFVKTDGVISVDNVCVEPQDSSVDEVENCDGNPVTNGTFNGDASGWYTYGGEVNHDATAGVGGSGAVTLGAGGGDNGVGQLGIPVTGGENYLLRADIKRTDAGSYTTLTLKFYDGGGTELQVDNAPVRSPDFATNTISATAPATAVTAEIILGNNGSMAVIDNVCLLGGQAGQGAAPACLGAANNISTGGEFETSNFFGYPPSEANYGQWSGGGGFTYVNDANGGETGVRISGPNGYNAMVFNFTPQVNATYTASVDGKRYGSTYGQVQVYIRDGNTNVSQESAGINTEEYSRVETVPVTVSQAGLAGVVAFEMGEGGVMTIDNFCLIEEITLPVVLTAFSAEARDKVNVLRWETASEENTSTFQLERSVNGVSRWATVLEEAPKGGVQTGASYEVRDEAPLAVGYYRLRSLDFDGSEQVSDVVVVERDADNGVRVYPNPVGAVFTLETKLDEASDYQLLDATGRVLLSGRVGTGLQRTHLNASTINSGVYALRVGDKTIKIVK